MSAWEDASGPARRARRDAAAGRGDVSRAHEAPRSTSRGGFAARRRAAAASRAPSSGGFGALRRAAALVAPRRARLALSIALGTGAIAASVGLLTTSGYLIVRASEQPPILLLTVAIVGVRAFGLARAVLRYGERLASHDLAFRVLADLRGRFYERLAPLVPAGLPGLRAGDVLSRFVADVDQLQHLYLRALSPPVVAALVTAMAGTVAALLLPAAGVTLVAALVLAAVAVPAVSATAARTSARRQGPARAELSSELVEALGGAAELALLGQADVRLRRVRTADARLASLARRDAFAGGMATALGTLLAGLALVAVLAVALPAVRDGRMSGVALGALTLLALAAFEAVAPLPAAAQQLGACAAAAQRLEDLTEAPVPVADPPAPLAIGTDRTLSARGVRFGKVFAGVDLELRPGKAIALVGPSGGGKTTLAQLLVRLRDPDEGSITLGGVDVRELAQDELRRQVVLIAQDAHLFATTVRENLLLARRDATDAELLAALDAVGLPPLPEGLDTQAGEEGERLSGGQQRRIAVARGLVSNAPLLVFDEPAAHLDPPAVRALHERLAAERATRGVLVIAHSFAGLEGYDAVFALEGGRVVPSSRASAGSPAACRRPPRSPSAGRDGAGSSAPSSR